MLYGKFLETCQCPHCPWSVSICQSPSVSLLDNRNRQYSIISHNLLFLNHNCLFSLNLAPSKPQFCNWVFTLLTYRINIKMFRTYSRLTEVCYFIFFIYSWYIIMICLIYSCHIMLGLLNFKIFTLKRLC